MHRGRVQSQGGSKDDSESWGFMNPISKSTAITKTDALEKRQTKKEKQLRKKSFNKAKKFIEDAAKNGGVSAQVSKTYLVKDKKHMRVDIEVIKGEAFK